MIDGQADAKEIADLLIRNINKKVFVQTEHGTYWVSVQTGGGAPAVARGIWKGPVDKSRLVHASYSDLLKATNIALDHAYYQLYLGLKPGESPADHPRPPPEEGPTKRVIVKRPWGYEAWTIDLAKKSLAEGHLSQKDIVGVVRDDKATEAIQKLEQRQKQVEKQIAQTTQNQTQKQQNIAKSQNEKPNIPSRNLSKEEYKKMLIKEVEKQLGTKIDELPVNLRNEVLDAINRKVNGEHVQIQILGITLPDLSELKIKRPKEKPNISDKIAEKAVELEYEGGQTKDAVKRLEIGAELAGLGFATGLINVGKGLVNLGREAVHNPVKAGEDFVKGTAQWFINLPRRVVKALSGDPFEAGEIAGEIVAGEVIGKVADVVPEEPLKVAERVTEPIKKAIDERLPRRQTILKGARIIEYETDQPLTDKDVMARIDAGSTKMIDLANTQTVRGIRTVELITEKRWKLGKSEPVDVGDSAKTLAKVEDITIDKSPTGDTTVTKKSGLGKAEIEFHRREINTVPTSLEEISSAIQTTEVGKVPNVKGELMVTPSNYGKLIDILAKEFKQEGVDVFDLSTIKKASEIVREGEETQIYHKAENGDIIDLKPKRKLRVINIEFKPELTKEILQQSNKLERLEGAEVKPEDLVEKELELKPRVRDKVLGKDIKEVVEKSEKDIAMERLTEYRKELAKTLRDIYGGKKETATGLELLEKANEEITEKTELLTDYPVLEEKSVTDIINEGLERVRDTFEKMKDIGEEIEKVALSGLSTEHTTTIKSAKRKVREFDKVMRRHFEGMGSNFEEFMPRNKDMEKALTSNPIDVGEFYSTAPIIAPAEAIGVDVDTLLGTATKQVTEQISDLPEPDMPDIPDMDLLEPIFEPPPEYPKSNVDIFGFGTSKIKKGYKVNPIANNPLDVSFADKEVRRLMKML